MCVLALAGDAALAQDKQAAAKGQGAAFDASACLACHAPVKALLRLPASTRTVGCDACHDGTAAHLADSSKRPATKTDLATCGGCHQNQYKSYAQMDWRRTARFEKKQMTGPAPDPAYDLLMTPHGFTKEHNLPRGHTFALLDQYVVDRAFGGRFAPKDKWRYLAARATSRSGTCRSTSIPTTPTRRCSSRAPRPRPTRSACRARRRTTSSNGRTWATRCRAPSGAARRRSSRRRKSVNHSLNCIFCHDPHAAKPRIVRDALIEAVTRTDAPTLYSQDPRKTKVDVKDMGVRGFTRKVGMLERYDGRLQCGQCHVEYNCNPGFNPNTGEPITMADKRTNYFPFVDVNNVLKAYDGIQFRDFRNQFTGAALWKAQHPDVETYYNSTHEKLGIDCAACHMPKVKDAKSGKVYTSHWQTNPKNYLKETCLQCHSQWTEQQARYVIESMAIALPGQGAARRVLARAAHQQVRPGAARRRVRGNAERGARQARRGACELGMVDRRQRRVVPQPRPRESFAREIGDRFAGGHQDPRRRDQGETDAARRCTGCAVGCAEVTMPVIALEGGAPGLAFFSFQSTG